VTFAPEDAISTHALWRIPKTGGALEKIVSSQSASGGIANVFIDATGLY
jgi:hypothetical protein